MASEILNFFHGDELAASVWEKKYKFGNEKIPTDSFRRYCKEIAEKEIERANTFTLYQEIDSALSDYGKQRWYNVKQIAACGNPHSRREMMNEHFLDFINFDNIILGGSMLATIGNHKSYSSLSNCFVLGQPYDSYAGINQKSMEMCEVMKRRGGCVEQHTKVIIRGENNERIIKEIKDVKIGDYILSFNVKTGEDEWKRVNDHYIVDVPFEKQITYKYSDGTYIKTSSTHPVLTILDKQYGYGSFENQTDEKLPNYYEPNILESYNKAPNKNYIEQFWNEELSEIGWLIGAHIGDGTSDIVKNECGSDTTRIRFSKSDKEVVEKYKSIIEKITGSNTKVVLNTSKRYQTEVWSYFSTNKNNSIFIEKYFDSQRNNKTLTAKIPSFIKENNLWIPFIAGLIDTDGFTIDGGKFEITLSNQNVISELTEWIKSINDLCNVKIRTDNRKETFNDSYTLSIYSYSKIYNLIAKYLVNKKRIKEVGKQQSQNFALLNNEIDTVLSFKMSNIKDKTMYDRILGNRKHLKKTHRANLMSLQNYQQFNMFDNNEINSIISRTKLDKVFYDKSKKQVYYDISVEDNNNYYAGNFGFVVIHNCGIDISTLRPDGAAVHNQSNESCGPVLFAERYSFISSEIAQRGRRGALMISINIAHPNALDFIQSKQDLTKITGANISVVVNNEFMNKVIDKKDNYYIQHFPCNVPIEAFDLTDIHVEDYSDLIETAYTHNGKQNIGYVRIVNAKEIWNKIIHCAWATAEPGIIFGDNWFDGGTDGVYDRYRAVTTNPCFAGETPVMTDKGYFQIKDLVGKKVNVWNGKHWSEVEPQITNHNQEMLKITLSDGSEFRCTKYHNFPVWKGFSASGHEEMTQAQHLSVGDKLSKFRLPVIEGADEISVDEAYTQGFYSGDGTASRNCIYLYDEPKINCAQFMLGNLDVENVTYQNGIRRLRFNLDFKNYGKDFVPDCNYSIKTRLAWLAGLIDSDCCVDKQEGGGSAQIGSTNLEFLHKIKLMLTTLGIPSRINNLRKAGYRLLINAANIQKLIRLGLETHRVDFTWVNPNVRDSSRFITVAKIEKSGIDENVYCFTEKEYHKAIFNGFLLGQCSEIPMQAYDSCRLASINLFSFVKNPFTSNAEFDFERFYKVAYEQVCILDNLVDLEAKYINRIIEKINSDTDEPLELRKQSITLWKRILNEGKSGRRLGAGFTALGDTLAALGLNYSIDINTEYFLNKLFECKMRAELDATIDLAILFGTFEGFDVYKEFDKSLTSGKNRIFQTIIEHFPEQAKRMQLYGRRNVSWSTAAPTGSLSILTQTTSGVEPLFLPWYERRKKITSHTERVDYIDPADGNKFTVFFVLHPKFKLWLEMQGINPDNLSKTQLQKLFEQSPWYGSCANDINWEDRVIIQSIVQSFTTHAISSTINLPHNINEQTISNIYLKSWNAGLKGNTVYRDGSRGGVIVSTDKKQQSDDDFIENRAPKRPKELKAYYHTLQSKGTVYAVIIGLLENKPYEVFITSGLDNLPINLDEFEDRIEGEIVKEYKNRYDFVCDGFILRDLADVEFDEKMVSLMISMGLRHRTPLKFVIKTLEKMQPIAGSFTHRLIKILSKYIPNGEEYAGDKCPDCGDTLRYENGCCICPSCGYTKC